MDPLKINYVSNNSNMVVNNYCFIRQLFGPFKVQVIHAKAILVKNAWIVVEEVKKSDKFLLLYRIGRNWGPYYVFKLSVEFLEQHLVNHDYINYLLPHLFNLTLILNLVGGF